MTATSLPRPMSRLLRPDRKPGRLLFAQVREDAELEIAAIAPGAEETIVVVGSGGCTALSLLAAGAGRVVSVDVNPVQNYLVELKAEAVRCLPGPDAVAFLGGAPCPGAVRGARYRQLRRRLGAGARGYWDGRPGAVAAGVIRTGTTEHFIRAVVQVIRTAIHPEGRIRRMLACGSLEEQRELYRAEWNSRRWRALFGAMLNRWMFERAYDPAFFRHVENPSFAAHFLRLAEHSLTEVPVATNYFLHQMLTGHYPAGALPRYLAEPHATADCLSERLGIVDGSYTGYLKTCPAGSIDGFALSNICEWLAPEEIDELFGEVARTAAHGARVCFRNFVGWTVVPERFRQIVVEDTALGEAMMRGDRAVIQRRFAPCRVREATR